MVNTAIIVVLFALVSSLLIDAADCNTSSFSALASSPAVGPCLQRSNISIAMLYATPTPEQRAIVCKTPACRELLDALLQLNLSECTIPFGGRLRLQADLIEPTVSSCASANASGAQDHEVTPPVNETPKGPPASASTASALVSGVSVIVGLVVGVVLVAAV